MDLRVTSFLIFWSLLVVVPIVIEGFAKVNLVVTDENGGLEYDLIPGTTMNLNCTYNGDPVYLNFYNGTEKNIFVWNFKTGKGLTGPGFEKSVKSNTKGDGWVSIKFEVPYCYKDEVIKCTVVDEKANKNEDKRTFPIGTRRKPSQINGTSCNEVLLIQQNIKEVSLSCSVFGIQPEANFTWSDGCSEIRRVSTEDTEKCFFDQTSTAICEMDMVQQKMAVTCFTDNGLGGKRSCILNFKNGAASDNMATIALSVTILVVIIDIAARL